jgi:hypothetical protein
MSQNPYKVIQVNSDLARLFQQIVTAGWANKSDGSDDFGKNFALINIEPAEMKELIDAVFDGGEPLTKIYPGSYVLVEDSDGNATLTEYLADSVSNAEYDRLYAEYTAWLDTVEGDV